MISYFDGDLRVLLQICRYSQKYAMIRGRIIRVNNCHCCGYIYDYVEYGEVCTGYCKLSDEDKKYGE